MSAKLKVELDAHDWAEVIEAVSEYRDSFSLAAEREENCGQASLDYQELADAVGAIIAAIRYQLGD